MVKDKKEVTGAVSLVDNLPQMFDTLSSLMAYETKRRHLIDGWKIKPQTFDVLLFIYTNYIYTGHGITLNKIDSNYNFKCYTSIHNRVTTLFNRGLVERCFYRGCIVFVPSYDGIIGMRDLMRG